ncbi:MAG: phosphate ABC transporter substrate-binding protein [Chloroflexi bacterium]|nr:phosphate ABC transporter substrate-binding protein [Chloroflexota bacterium]
MRGITAALLGSLILWLSACGGVEPPQPVHVTITGSTAMAPLLQSLSEEYHQTHPYVTFSVGAQGSALGLAMAQQGTADLGMVARKLTPDETFDPATGRRRLWSTVIARDGIALIVNPQNPLSGLRSTQLQALVTGEIPRWADAGWDGTESVQVVSREDGAATRMVFEALALHGTEPTLNAIVMPTSQAMAQFVAQHRNAIGYLSMGLATGQVKTLALDGVYPTPGTTGDGTYPLTRPFLLVSGKAPQGEVGSFLHWVTGPAGQAIIRERYALPK